MIPLPAPAAAALADPLLPLLLQYLPRHPGRQPGDILPAAGLGLDPTVS